MFQRSQIKDILYALNVLIFWKDDPDHTYNRGQEALELNTRFKAITDQTPDPVWDALVADFLKLIQDKSLVNKLGQTPINDMAATHFALSIFIQAGLDVNNVDSKGSTALNKAALFGKKESIKLLLDAGANPNLMENTGDYPIHRAIQAPCLNEGDADACVDMLIKAKADLSIQDGKGHTPLVLALLRDRNHMVQSLIKAGAEATKASSAGHSPLALAVMKDPLDLELVKYILSQGADPNQKLSFGLTIMMVAEQNDNPALIKLLVEHGATPPNSTQAQTHTRSPFCFSFFGSCFASRGQAQVAPVAGVPNKSLSVDL